MKLGHCAFRVLPCICLIVLNAHLRAADVPAATVPPSLEAVPDGFKLVDFRKIVNMGWQDEVAGDGVGGWTDQGDADMRGIETGLRRFLGIPFRLIDASTNDGKSVLTLKSRKFHAGPMSATLAVGAKAASVYFLHASAWTAGKMATYYVKYADGTQREIPIRAKEEICDWWGPQHGTSCRVAFQMPNLKTDAVGMLIFGWNNPDPDKTIAAIEFVSAMEDGIVVVAGVTLSNRPVLLPDPKDIPAPEYLSSDEPLLDKSQWFEVPFVRDQFQPTCIDQHDNLDGPAGKHGFMHNVDGSFVFEDGASGRLIGMHGPLPRNKEDAVFIARFLAKYGIGLVRLGHLVNGPGSPVQAEAVDWSQPDSMQLNEKVMDTYDFFIAELAKNGIYTRPSLLWYKAFRKEDGLDDFDNILTQQQKGVKTARIDRSKRPYISSATLTFIDPKIKKLNIALETKILTHRNPYRDNQMWGADPAICQLEIQNEESTFFYGFDGLTRFYKQKLDELWNAWLLKKYGSREGLSQAWGGSLGELEDPAQNRVKRMLIAEFNGVSARRARRAGDQMRFYYELATNYFVETKNALRAAGVKQPICGSGWVGVGQGYWPEIYSNVTGLDYTDRHYYYGGGQGWQMLPGNLFQDRCALKEPDLFLKLALERTLALPFGISEWNNLQPNQWRLESAPLMTFYGSCLNGWDAPVQFAYGYSYFEDYGGFPRKIHMVIDTNVPCILCQYAPLHIALRRRDIKEGPPVFVKHLSENQMFSGKPIPGLALRYDQQVDNVVNDQTADETSLRAMFAGGVGKTGLAFSAEDQPDFSVDLAQYIDLKKKEIRSATGELYWNYGAGYVTANTDKTQAVVGFIRNTPVELKDCRLVTDNVIVSVILTSLDDLPIAHSRHLLLTAVGRTRNTGMYYNQVGRRLLTLGQAPLLQEGVRGTFTLKRSGKVSVTALSPAGYPTVEVAPQVEAGQVNISLDGRNKATYYEIKVAE